MKSNLHHCRSSPGVAAVSSKASISVHRTVARPKSGNGFLPNLNIGGYIVEGVPTGMNATSHHKFDFNYLFPFARDGIVTYERCVELVGTGVAWYDRKDVYHRVLLWRVPLLALWATTTLPAFGRLTQLFTLVHLIADPIDTIWSLLYKLDLARRTTQWTKENDWTASSFTFLSEGAQVEEAAAAEEQAAVEEEDAVELHTTSRALTAGQERTALINEMLQRKSSPLLRYFHDVPPLIITAYDEWGYGDHASMAMNYGL